MGGGKGGSPPPAPDYAGMAAAQGAANVEAARQTAFLSNPNVISPTGRRTVTYNTTYDKPEPVKPVSMTREEAVAELSRQGINAPVLDSNAKSGQVFYNRNLGSYNAKLNELMNPSMDAYNKALEEYKASAFTTPTITEELTPEAQAAFSAQQKAQQALSELGYEATGTVRDVMGRPFQYTGPGVQTSLGNTGRVNTRLNLQGQATGGPAAGQYGWQQGGVESPRYQQNLSGFGNVSQEQIASPELQQTLADSGNLARGINTQDLAAMPVNAGITGQQAIMSRLQPQLEQQRSALQTQLANQGITPGSVAYQQAMTEQNQRENDLQTQAALQGLNLDMAARQQGFGEAQTTAGFTNAAQQQAFNQALASGQYGNQAAIAQFGARLQGRDAYNAAQQQAFNQAVASGQFGNEAQTAAFQAALANQQAGNQASAANFAQAQAAAQMGNQALGQNWQNQLAQWQAQNAAQNQQYNQALQSAQFANTADQQEFQRQLGLYNLPLNQVTALLSGGQVQMPTFQPYQGVGVTAAPVFQAGQAQNQYNMDVYNAQVASDNATKQALGQTVATAGMFALSDRRAKTDIEKIGKLDSGLNLYKFKYIGSDIQQVGVMSDEVREIFPDAVVVGEDGFDRVNYSKLV